MPAPDDQWEEEDLSGQRHMIVDAQGRRYFVEYGSGVTWQRPAGGAWVLVPEDGEP